MEAGAVDGAAERAAERPSVAANDGIPGGPWTQGSALRPHDGPRTKKVCSQLEPICVHGDAAPRALLAVLASAERAWDVETGALDLPAPDADLITGAFDVYLVPSLPEGTLTAPSGRDPRSRIDRASAFALLDASLAVGGACPRDTAVAALVALASLSRASPATGQATARAQAAYVSRLAVPCAMGELGDIDVFQAAPELAIMDSRGEWDARASVAFERGASLFYWWLDAAYSVEPGGIVRALWALSATKTPPQALRWNDEPDSVDVLRESFKDALTNGSTVEDLFAEFGTTRALLGPRENGLELPEARPLGEATLPRLDWTLDWPDTPRRLASPVGVEATGSAYVLVHRAGAPPGARLRVEAAWEQHSAIRWTAVKLDAAGRELGRIPVPSTPRSTEAQTTLVGLDAADAILLVATNVGDPFDPLEPDDEVFEPHGWLLTLARE
jgi:hypothetical protein